MTTLYNPIGWANRVKVTVKESKKSNKNQLTNSKSCVILSSNKKES